MEIEELVRSLTKEEFAKKIDHTLLRPDATFEDLKRACLDSAKHRFAACCISPWFVKYAREILEGTGVKVATVIAFPHGTAPMDAKVEEARIALESGAEELDMVMNVSAFKSGLYELVADEVNRVVCLAEERGALVKVIIETAYLSDEEKAEIGKVTVGGSDQHRFLIHTYFGESVADMPPAWLDRMYQAQCVWEETMAENIARDLKGNPGKMVVFTGNSHIVNRFGIPERVLRRIQVKTATVVLYPLTERSILFKNMADYVWLTAACSAGKYGRHTMRLRKPGENNNNEINAGKNR